MLAFFQTRYGPTCEILIDVTVQSPEPGVSTMGDLSEFSDCCEECMSVIHTNWEGGDPCPKCGGVIDQDGDVF